MHEYIGKVSFQSNPAARIPSIVIPLWKKRKKKNDPLAIDVKNNES